VFYDTHDKQQLMEQLYCTPDNDEDETFLRVPNGVEFQHHLTYRVCTKFKLHDMAECLIYRSYPEDEQTQELQDKIANMRDQDKIETGRKLLSGLDWLLHIQDLKSARVWNLIRRELLPNMSAGTCIIVTTNDQSLATHCVGLYQGDRVLNFNDLLKVRTQFTYY
jgi:hypothetical protein